MRRLVLPLFLLALPLTACGSTADSAPLPTAANQQPFKLTKIAPFDTPWAMSVLPDSTSALVSERDGRLWLVDLASGTRTAIGGVPKPVVAGQGGLGDIILAPDFATSHRVYLSWVDGVPGQSGAVVASANLGEGPQPALQNLKIIWRQTPKVSGDGHFSHRILVAPDGNLFISSGERQKFDPAQDMGVNLGKIVRITPDGAPASGNPWASRGGLASTFYSMGHRNALGLALDAQGRLWETEMGPQGGDELNLIKPGQNYGWPKASNGSHYDGRDIPDHAPGDGFAAPAAWWNPSISPGGLAIYKGSKWPWTGNALVPALSGQGLARLTLDGDTATKADYWDLGMRVRAVAEAPDGTLYLLEDTGALYRLDKA